MVRCGLHIVSLASIAMVLIPWHNTHGYELNAACSKSGNCSRSLQLLLNACTNTSNSTIKLTPPGAMFKLEQSSALNLTKAHLWTFDGQGAELVLKDGSSRFLYIDNCSSISISNFTLRALRPTFTLGTVMQSDSQPDPIVYMSVNTSTYPFTNGWTTLVAALHEVTQTDQGTFLPKIDGLDWISLQGRLPLTVHTDIMQDSDSLQKVSMTDLGFNLSRGTQVILRHMLEFTQKELDAIVVRGSSGLMLSNFTIFSSPGMSVLIFDSTDIALDGVATRPYKNLPLAANADAFHLSSCRGKVSVRRCVANQQGDDGLNIHSQQAIISHVNDDHESDDSMINVTIVPNLNADGTDWGCLFASPVFRVHDILSLRRGPNLTPYLDAVVVELKNYSNSVPHNLLLRITTKHQRFSNVSTGDIIESGSALPSAVTISGNKFVNSRASGIILMCSNVSVHNNNISNMSSNGIAVGGYWKSFGESPLGSNIMVADNSISGCGRGHRTVPQGEWGQGPAVRIAAPMFNMSSLHQNVSFYRNTISTVDVRNRSTAALQIEATDSGKAINNTFCVYNTTAQTDIVLLENSDDFVNYGNLCCDGSRHYRHCT